MTAQTHQAGAAQGEGSRHSVSKLVTGDSISTPTGHIFESCYANTHLQYNSPPGTNLDFFRRIGASMADNVLLVVARGATGQAHRPARSTSTTRRRLYGPPGARWNTTPACTFEACYYQAM